MRWRSSITAHPRIRSSWTRRGNRPTPWWLRIIKTLRSSTTGTGLTTSSAGSRRPNARGCRDSPTGGALTSARKNRPMRRCTSGTRRSRHGGRPRILPAIQRPQSRSGNGSPIRIRTPLNIRCGATAWHSPAWYSCFRALCITHSSGAINPADILRKILLFACYSGALE